MESLDLIATKKPFLYKGKNTYKTAFGGSLTILFIGLAIFISYYFLKTLLDQSEYATLNKFEASSTEGWDPLNITVLLKMNKTEEKIFWAYYQINEKTSIDYNQPCTAEELEVFSEDPSDAFFSFYCARIYSFSRWSFKVRCYFDRARKIGLECDSKNLTLSFKVLSQEFISESYGEIKNKIYEYLNISKNNTNFFYNINKLIIDKDYFFSNPQIYYYSDFSDINSYPQWFANKESVISNLFEFKPQKSFIIEKKFKKFGDELAKISALLQLLLISFNLIYQLISDYLFEKENFRNLLELLDVNEFAPQAPTEKQLKENIKNKLIEITTETKDSLLETFSFRNYLFSNIFPFCFCELNPSAKKYLSVREKLTTICSYENFIFKAEPEKATSPAPSECQQNSTLKRLLTSIDFMAQSPIILIKNQAAFKTKFGGFLFVLILITSSLLFYFFGEDFFQQLHPSVSYNENKLSTLNNTGFELDVPFMLGISKPFAAATKLVYFTMDNQTYNDAQAKKCTLDEIQSFNVSQPEQDLDYFCFNYKQIVKDPISAKNVYLFGALCRLLQNYNISDDECKGNPEPAFNSTIAFEFYKKTRKFAQEDFLTTNDLVGLNINNNSIFGGENNKTVTIEKENPLDANSKDIHKNVNDEWVITSIKNSPQYDLNTTSFMNFHITDKNKINKISIDKNYFISDPDITYAITNPPFQQTNSEPTVLRRSSRFGVLYIETNPIILETTIVYQKFDQMFARVMSLISLFYLFLKIINNYVSDYFLMDRFKEDFFIYLMQINSKRLYEEKLYFLINLSNLNISNHRNNNNFHNNSSMVNVKDVEETEGARRKEHRLLKLVNFRNFIKSGFICLCEERVRVYGLIYNEFRSSLSSESFIKFSNCIREKEAERNKCLYNGEKENVVKENQYNNNLDNSNKNNHINNFKNSYGNFRNVNDSNSNLNILNNNINNSNSDLNLLNNQNNNNNLNDQNNPNNRNTNNLAHRFNSPKDPKDPNGLIEKTNENKTNNINTNNNSSCSGLLQKLDFLFIYDDFFYYRKNKSFKSAAGGVISLLYLILIVFVTVFFGNDFWSGKMTAIRTNQVSSYETENKTNDLDMPFALGFSRELADAVYFEGKYYASRLIKNRTFYSVCTDEQLKQFNKSLVEPSIKEKMFFVCSNFNLLLGNPYLFHQELWADFYIRQCLKSHINKTDYPSCKKTPNMTAEYYSEIYYITDEIDYSEFTVSKKIVKQEKRGLYKDLLRIVVFLQRYEIRDKAGKLKGDQLDKGKSKRLIYAISDSISTDNWVSISPYLDKSLTIITKELVYESLPEALARVFAMSGIASSIFYFLHFTVFKFLYFKSVLESLLRSSEAKRIQQRFLAETAIRNENDINKDYKFSKEKDAEMAELHHKFLFIEFVEQKVFVFKFYLMAHFSFVFGKTIKEYIIIENILKEYISIETLYRNKIKMQVGSHNELSNNFKGNNLTKLNSVVKVSKNIKMVLRENSSNKSIEDKDADKKP